MALAYPTVSKACPHMDMALIGEGQRSSWPPAQPPRSRQGMNDAHRLLAAGRLLDDGQLRDARPVVAKPLPHLQGGGSGARGMQGELELLCLLASDA